MNKTYTLANRVFVEHKALPTINKNHRSQLTLVLIGSLALTFLTFHYLDRKLYHTSPSLWPLTMQKYNPKMNYSDRVKLKVYYRYLNRGNRYRLKEKYYLAIKEYSVAKRIYESKEANYAMSLALISVCDSDNVYCQQANEYYDYLMFSKHLTCKEKEHLTDRYFNS